MEARKVENKKEKKGRKERKKVENEKEKEEEKEKKVGIEEERVTVLQKKRIKGIKWKDEEIIKEGKEGKGREGKRR